MVWEILLSICCFYWLMNKAAFGQWLNRVKPSRKFKQRWRKRVGRVREKPCSHLQDTDAPEPFW